MTLDKCATHENNQYSEDLQHQPTVTRDARVVLEQFSLRAADVRCDVDGVRVDALNGFPLLRHHLGQLSEYLTEFGDSRFNGLDGR